MLQKFYNSLITETQKTQQRIVNIASLKQKKSNADSLTSFQVLGKFGRCRLLYFSPANDCGHAPLFIVPSLINKYYILDLMKGVSLIEHLKLTNVPVYLIDWGSPRTQDRVATLEDHILHWMDWALRESCKHAGVEKIDIFGQCIGGTFAAIYAALKPEQVKSIIVLTAPVSFHDDGLLSTWSKHGKIDLELICDQWGNVYRGFLKESFTMLKPLDRARKYNNLIKHSWNVKFLDRHAAITRWVDDCIAFPGKTYARYIKDFYKDNLLIKGELKLGENLVKLENISCPVFVISSKEDEIVPYESAVKLLDLVSSARKELKLITGGHIGILLSSKAKDNLWRPVENWVKHEGMAV